MMETQDPIQAVRGPLLLASGLLILGAFQGCAETRKDPRSEPVPARAAEVRGPALAIRASPGIRVSIVWDSGDATRQAQLMEQLDGPAAREAWNRWRAEHQ